MESPSIAETVKRNPWEAAHQWEARVKFVEDNYEQHGLEKAIRLSILWHNFHFLGCRYHPNAEAMVTHYPLPDRETLKARTRARKRSPNDEDTDGGPAKRPKLNSYPLGSACEGNSAPALATHHSTPVDALISSVRHFHESGRLSPPPPPSLQDAPPAAGTPLHPLLQRVGDCVCSCDKCTAVDRAQIPLGALEKILILYGKSDKQFSYSWNFPEPSRFAGPGGLMFKCQLLINGAVVAEEEQASKKNIKGPLATRLLRQLDDYRSARQLPCPRLGMKVGQVTAEELNGAKRGPDPATTSLPESNKGNQLLRKMGWTESAGLGPDGKGATNTLIVATGLQHNRRLGFGASAGPSGIDLESLRERLQEFVRSDEAELRFPSALSSEERALVHRLSLQFGLGHRSQGQGEGRHIVVSKKTEPLPPLAPTPTAVGTGEDPPKNLVSSAFFAPAVQKVYGSGYVDMDRIF